MPALTRLQDHLTVSETCSANSTFHFASCMQAKEPHGTAKGVGPTVPPSVPIEGLKVVTDALLQLRN